MPLEGKKPCPRELIRRLNALGEQKLVPKGIDNESQCP